MPPRDKTDIADSATEMSGTLPYYSSTDRAAETPSGDASAGSKPFSTAKPVDQSDTPATIGRFEIRRRLGRGGFGNVYLAFDPTLQREIALKVARVPAGRADHAQRFLREARNSARLQHPHVITVHEAGETPDHGCYIAMEYVAGETLAQRLRRGPLSMAEAVRICGQVAAAVQAAHGLEIVHRDLKPANILLDSRGDAKVCDFGLALDEDALRSHAGERSGTLAYMSPEQVRGECHRLDGRSDIWSLGVILYECLTGKRPFRGSDSAELCDEILTRDCKPLRQFGERIPSDIDQLCQKCLRRNIEERLRTAADFQKVLAAAVLPPDDARKPRRRGLAGVILAACLLAGCGLSAWGLMTIGQLQLDEGDLLALPPRPIVLSSDPKSRFDHQPAKRRFLVDSPQWSLFACGEHSGGAKITTIATSQRKPGTVGLFWGLHRETGDDAGNRSCMAVVVEPLKANDANAVARMFLFRMTDAFLVNESSATTKDLASANMVVDWNRPLDLMITIEEGELAEFKVQSRNVHWPIVPAAREWRQFSTGECGVVAAHEPILFARLFLEPHK